MDYNIREMTIGDYEEALTLTIFDLRFLIIDTHFRRRKFTIDHYRS